MCYEERRADTCYAGSVSLQGSSPLLVSRDIGPDRDREGNDEFWTLLIAHPMFCLLG